MYARRLIALIVCLFGLLTILRGNMGHAVLAYDSGPREMNVSKPIPGKVIVSIVQEGNEADYFTVSNDGKVVTRYDASALSQLGRYGIKGARKGFQRGSNATYELTFDATGQEDEIIQYLRSLPNVRYAQRDYTVEFLT